MPWLATAFVPAPSLEEIVNECGPLPAQAVRWIAHVTAAQLRSDVDALAKGLLEYDTLEEAVAAQQEFADLHAKHWPECEMVATLRQISEAPPEPSDA